jgi:hypothetical protein
VLALFSVGLFGCAKLMEGMLGGADWRVLRSDDLKQPLVPFFCLSSALALTAVVGSCYIYILKDDIHLN